MRLLVSGATATLRRLAPTCGDVLGCLPTPATVWLWDGRGRRRG